MLTKIKENIFYLFIFILPWQTIFLLKETFIAGEKFQYATIGIYLFQLILFIWITFNYKKLFTCVEKNLIYILGIYLIWIFLSIFWSTDKGLALYFFITHLLGVCLFLIIQSSAINFKKFSFSLISSVTLSSFLALFQFFYQLSFSNKWLGLSEHLAWQGGSSVIENGPFRFLRAYGSLPHPNILGGILVVTILLSIGAYFKAAKSELRWKMLLVATLPINFLALIVSFSRASFLALIFGTLSITFYFLVLEKSKKKKDFMVIFYALVVLSSIFFVAYSDLISSRSNPQSRLEKKSLVDRELYIKDAQKIIFQNPLLGAGLGNYSLEVMKSKNIKKEIWQIQPVHNLYLLIFSEIGIIGFSILIFFVIFNILEIFKSLKERDTNRIIFSFIFVSLLFICLFDHWLWSFPFGITLFWLILGFSKEKKLHCL